VFDSEVRPTEIGPSLFDLCARVNGPRRRESRAKRAAERPFACFASLNAGCGGGERGMPLCEGAEAAYLAARIRK